MRREGAAHTQGAARAEVRRTLEAHTFALRTPSGERGLVGGLHADDLCAPRPGRKPFLPERRCGNIPEDPRRSMERLGSYVSPRYATMTQPLHAIRNLLS